MVGRMIGALKRRRVVGLAIGGASSVAVLANRGKPGGEAKLLKVATAPAVDFQSAPPGDLPDDLDKIIKSLALKLGREARRADTPTAIALPDPVFREDRLTFSEVPDRPDALQALIKWRIAREHRLNADDIAASHQRLPSGSEDGGEDGGDARYLVRFAAKATIDAVEAAARRAGLTPTLIEAQSRFQALPDPAADAMAQVTVADRWWSLVYRDAATPECHVRSDWRSGDLTTLTASLTRLIRTMSRAESKLAVAISAAEGEADALIEALKTRLDGNSTIHPVPPNDDRAVALLAATA